MYKIIITIFIITALSSCKSDLKTSILKNFGGTLNGQTYDDRIQSIVEQEYKTSRKTIFNLGSYNFPFVVAVLNKNKKDVITGLAKSYNGYINLSDEFIKREKLPTYLKNANKVFTQVESILKVKKVGFYTKEFKLGEYDFDREEFPINFKNVQLKVGTNKSKDYKKDYRLSHEALINNGIFPKEISKSKTVYISAYKFKNEGNQYIKVPLTEAKAFRKTFESPTSKILITGSPIGISVKKINDNIWSKNFVSSIPGGDTLTGLTVDTLEININVESIDLFKAVETKIVKYHSINF